MELDDAVKDAGYPAKNSTALYSQVFAAAKRDLAVKKTAARYALKA